MMSQTYSPQQVIVADDASTDESGDVIRDYERRFPGIVVGVHNPKNLGIPMNRNSGLRHLDSDYVFILDGDDLFLPGNIERMVRALSDAPESRCVFGNVDIVDSNGSYIETRDRQPQPQGRIFFELARGRFGFLRNMLIEAALLREVGMLDPNLPRYDGYDLTVRLARAGDIAYVPEPGVAYRVHETSDSRGLNAQDHLHDLELIRRRILRSLDELTVDQAADVRATWDTRMTRFHVSWFHEHPTRTRRWLTAWRLVLRRHIGPQDLRRFEEVIVEHTS